MFDWFAQDLWLVNVAECYLTISSKVAVEILVWIITLIIGMHTDINILNFDFHVCDLWKKTILNCIYLVNSFCIVV